MSLILYLQETVATHVGHVFCGLDLELVLTNYKQYIPVEFLMKTLRVRTQVCHVSPHAGSEISLNTNYQDMLMKIFIQILCMHYYYERVDRFQALHE